MEPNNSQTIGINNDETIDFKKYFFLILGHWWWFAISIFLSLTIAYLVNRYSQKIYSTKATIIISDGENATGSIESLLEDFTRTRNKKRKAVVENEISILKSYKLARLTLSELDFGITYVAVGRRNIAETQLYKNQPFDVIIDSSKTTYWGGKFDVTILNKTTYKLEIGDNFSTKLKFGEDFVKTGIAFKIVLKDPENYSETLLNTNKYYFAINNIHAQANHYSAKLGVQVNDDKGSILTLTMTGFVPMQITDYLNKLCEVFIRSNLEEKNIASENTIKFIDTQLRGVVDSLEATGIRLQNFRSANRVIDISKEGTFLFERLRNLQSEKAALEIKARYFAYLLEYIEEKTDYSDVVAPSVIGVQDELLNNLVIELNRLNSEQRNLTYSVNSNSPQIKLLDARIINTQANLKENLTSLIKGNNLEIAGIEEQLKKFENEVHKLPATERQLIDIEREFTINDQIYTFLLEKRAEAGITRASNTSDHKILDTALPENTWLIKPKTSMNYTLGIVLGVFIPLILLIAFDFFNFRIQSKSSIENNSQVPILASIGHNEKVSELPIFNNPKSALAESFRGLRANLQFFLKQANCPVIAVTSTVSGEGKTFCANNLASILALAGYKTLLVSLDLRRPRVHRVFGINNSIGLSNYLIGQADYGEILKKSTFENLHIASAGPIPPNPSELIGSERMKEFIIKA